MSTKAEEFSAVLPAVLHMAKFRGANRDVICRKYGVATADLEAVVAREFGSWANVDEESLEEVAKKLGVALGDYHAPPPATAAAKRDRVPSGAEIDRMLQTPPRRGPGRPRKEAAEVNITIVERKPTAAELSAMEKQIVAAVREQAKPKKRAPAAGQAARLAIIARRTREKYRGFLTWLDVHPGDDLAPALKRHGLTPGGWTQFKLKQFGKGPVTAAAIAKYLGPPAAPPACLPANPSAGSGSVASAAAVAGPADPGWLELSPVGHNWQEHAHSHGTCRRPGLTLNTGLVARIGAALGDDFGKAKRVRLFFRADKRTLGLRFGAEGFKLGTVQGRVVIATRQFKQVEPGRARWVAERIERTAAGPQVVLAREEAA